MTATIESKLPKRPKSHIIGVQAIITFRESLPENWILREVIEDYGIDCEIEIVDEQSSVTGAIIKAQVKGTSSINDSCRKSVYIRLATVRYWLTIPVPVILVRVTELPKKILWLEVREYLLETDQLKLIDETKKKNIRFKFKNTDLLTNPIIELGELALYHQFAVQQWRRNQDSQLMTDWIGFHLLVKVFNGNPDKWLKWLREKGSDEQLANDFAFVLWLKKEFSKDHTFLQRINRIIQEYDELIR